MQQLWPHNNKNQPFDLGEGDLEELYGYPERWLAVNFVSSVDGAVELAGHSAGLSTAPDRVVYQLGSDLADVVLLGAGTATIEEFHGIRPDEQTSQRRTRHGLSPVPPIAVVSSGNSLPADAPVLTDVLTPSIVLTCDTAPSATCQAWTDAGATVITVGHETVDLPAAIAALAQRGLTRIDCEGGPHLLGALLEAGLVDELRLTLSPVLVSGTADRIAVGASIDPARLRLASVLTEADTLLLRYLVDNLAASAP